MAERIEVVRVSGEVTIRDDAGEMRNAFTENGAVLVLFVGWEQLELTRGPESEGRRESVRNAIGDAVLARMAELRPPNSE